MTDQQHSAASSSVWTGRRPQRPSMGDRPGACKRRPLTLVHAVGPQGWVWVDQAGAETRVGFEDLQSGPQRLIAGARSPRRTAGAHLDVHEVLRVADARDVLQALSREAAIVVSVARRGPIHPAAPLGQRRRTRYAACPVVVVRPGNPARRGGVLVGADGSEPRTRGVRLPAGVHVGIAADRPALPLTRGSVEPHHLVDAAAGGAPVAAGRVPRRPGREYPDVRVRTVRPTDSPTRAWSGWPSGWTWSSSGPPREPAPRRSSVRGPVGGGARHVYHGHRTCSRRLVQRLGRVTPPDGRRGSPWADELRHPPAARGGTRGLHVRRRRPGSACAGGRRCLPRAGRGGYPRLPGCRGPVPRPEVGARGTGPAPGGAAYLSGYDHENVPGNQECQVARVDRDAGRVLKWSTSSPARCPDAAEQFSRHGGVFAVSSHGLWVTGARQLSLLDPDAPESATRCSGCGGR